MEAIGALPGRSPGSAGSGGPAEEADREEEAGYAPEGDDGEVVPGDGGAAGGDVGVEEGVEEVADREEVGEGDDAVGELVFGDEDAGEEVERQQHRVDDRGGGVLGGDRGGEGDAEAAEGGGADDEGEQDRRQPVPGDVDAVEDAADRRQQDQHHQRDDDRVADPAGDEDPGRHRSPAAALEAAVFAGDHQGHRQRLHRRRDDRERHDRRHVIGGRLDPAAHVHGFAVEDDGEDEEDDHREHHREEDGGRVAPERLLVVAELVADESEAVHEKRLPSVGNSSAVAVSSR